MVVRETSAPWPAAGAAAPGERAENPQKILEAARQFEALLITQLLRAARGGDSASWLGAGEDQAAASAMEMAEECFAQALASQGGLGLAQLVADGLRQPSQALHPADTASSAGSSGQGGAATIDGG